MNYYCSSLLRIEVAEKSRYFVFYLNVRRIDHNGGEDMRFILIEAVF